MVNVKNEHIRCESGCRSFQWREATVMASWLLQIVIGGNQMSDLRRACCVDIQ